MVKVFLNTLFFISLYVYECVYMCVYVVSRHMCVFKCISMHVPECGGQGPALSVALQEPSILLFEIGVFHWPETHWLG